MADVGECAVTVVAIQGVGNRSIHHGASIGRMTIDLTRLVLLDTEVTVVGDEKIQMTVCVNIQKACSGAYLISIADTCSQGDICEGAISIVSIKNIRSEI